MAERKRVFRGDRLRALREARGVTQDQLAEFLGFGQSQVNKYELGKSEPSPEVITRLAREFEVTTDYLLGLVDKPKANLKMKDLSPAENQLLAAWRRGDFRELMKIATEKAPEGNS